MIELLWSVHRWVYRVSRGRLGSTLPGQLPVLLLTTIGRRTGLSWNHLLGYLAIENGYVVIGSNAGEPRHPGWYYNLKSKPEADVQAGTQRSQVRAREASGNERERLWAQIVERDRSYSTYQARTERRIPILVLEITSCDA